MPMTDEDKKILEEARAASQARIDMIQRLVDDLAEVGDVLRKHRSENDAGLEVATKLINGTIKKVVDLENVTSKNEAVLLKRIFKGEHNVKDLNRNLAAIHENEKKTITKMQQAMSFTKRSKL